MSDDDTICRNCAGDGGWTERVDETSNETVWVECSACGGSGECQEGQG